ncbi:hypothetical protein SCANM63S_01944 [Streptomyces canarius]
MAAYAARTRGQLVLVRAMQKRTSAGSRDTEVKEFTARPTGAASPARTAVTATTPVVNRPSVARNSSWLTWLTWPAWLTWRTPLTLLTRLTESVDEGMRPSLAPRQPVTSAYAK